MSSETATAPRPGISERVTERLWGRLSELWESWPARQRSLVAGISAGVLVLLLLSLGYYAYDRIDTLETTNDAMQRALRDIEKKRGAYVAAKARERSLEARVGNSPLQLSGFVEQMGKEVGIEIRETNPRSAETMGKKYIQQSVDLRISRVGLEPLLRFLRRMETYQQNLVLVTELAIRARDDKHQDFEVDMTVSTYEKAPKAKAAKPEPAKGGDTEKEAP